MRTPPPDDLRYSAKKKTMPFIGVEVEQETSAPLLKKILDPPLASKSPSSALSLSDRNQSCTIMVAAVCPVSCCWPKFQSIQF